MADSQSTLVPRRGWRLFVLLCVACFWPAASRADAGSPAAGQVLLKLRPSTAKSTAADAGRLHRLHAQVGFLSEAPLLSPAAGAAFAAKGTAGPTLAAPASLGARLGLWRVVRYSEPVDPLLVSAAYAQLEEVDAAQPNYLRRFCARIRDDPLLGQQPSLPAVGVDDPHPTDGEGVVVAVIDSGVDYLHADIADQVWTNPLEAGGEAGVDDDANGYVDDLMGWDFTDAPGQPGGGDFLERDADPMDESGHGTHVAGIIGAGVDNDIGIAGLAGGVQLMILRAGFEVGGGGGFLEDDDVAAAIVYAVDNGAHVINLSLGDPSFSPLLRDVIRYATEAGTVVVAAAGNEGNGDVFYPARLEQTIAVSATDASGRLASFSNWGQSIDLAGPGVSVLSLAPGDSYAERSGTSMSTAHVSGLAALLLSRWPHLNPEQLRAGLMQSALDVGARGWDPRAGAGLAQRSAATPASPLSVQIGAGGAHEVGEADSVGIEVTLMGSGTVSYALSWGAGVNPEHWIPFADRVADVVAGTRVVHEEAWVPGDLPDSTYVLRLEAVSGDSYHSDRLDLLLRRAAVAQLSSLRWGRALSGARWEYSVEWETETPSTSVVEVRLEGQGELLYVLPAPQRRVAHRVALPDDLPAGRYDVAVRTPPSAAAGGASISVVIPERSVARWHLQSEATLADGYLMPLTADFDADGRAELAAMVYGGRAYGPTAFFELAGVNGGGGQTPVHTSSRLYIPWGAHDLDADGQPEIMAVDAERVRLVESREPDGRFPDLVIWEQREVWGGEVGDLDADGRLEMYLRSSRGAVLRTYEHAGADNAFAAVAVNANPTTGPNSLGGRQVVGDFDGDGRGDLLVGDEDGDLFVLESIGDDALGKAWERTSDRDDVDGRLVGGGIDIDGDGRVEFVAGRRRSDRFDLDRTEWSVTVYEQRGDDEYEPEHEFVVLGGKGQGNGIAMGDVDGDGLVELCVSLVPDLYLLRARGPDEYEPVWHAPIRDTHRPLVADVDGDGVIEVAYNSIDERIEIASLADARAFALEAPAGVAAVSAGVDRIAVTWEPVAGASVYRVYRESGGLSEMIAQVDLTAYDDLDVDEGTRYSYSVAALEADGAEGRRSAPQPASSGPVPTLTGVERSQAHHLILNFDRPLGPSAGEAFRYRVQPDIGSPSSATRDHGGRRVVLTFAEALPVTGSYELDAKGLKAADGAGLSDEELPLAFALGPVEATTRLVHARIELPTRIVLRFSAALDEDSVAAAAIVIDDGRIAVSGVSILSPSEVSVALDPDTPLQPWGRRYEIRVDGWRDSLGGAAAGRTFVQLSPSVLGPNVVFPNPFDPAQGRLVFGGMPLGARVSIHSVAGELIRTLREAEGDGGVEWDGTNEAGELAASGIYYYRVIHEGVSRTGSFAVVRN